MPAMASISTFMPGTTNSLMPIRVLHGRESPKNSWRTGLIAARSSMSVR